mmetsp:Transcript_26509/g.79073  ORF Transcript_26509/g.79073 Transcript_26509/m.79073 type:complete len:297 (-) Transcript_26509:155-1045(-)
MQLERHMRVRPVLELHDPRHRSPRLLDRHVAKIHRPCGELDDRPDSLSRALYRDAVAPCRHHVVDLARLRASHVGTEDGGHGLCTTGRNDTGDGCERDGPRRVALPLADKVARAHGGLVAQAKLGPGRGAHENATKVDRFVVGSKKGILSDSLERHHVRAVLGDRADAARDADGGIGWREACRNCHGRSRRHSTRGGREAKGPIVGPLKSDWQLAAVGDGEGPDGSLIHRAEAKVESFGDHGGRGRHVRANRYVEGPPLVRELHRVVVRLEVHGTESDDERVREAGKQEDLLGKRH